MFHSCAKNILPGVKKKCLLPSEKNFGQENFFFKKSSARIQNFSRRTHDNNTENFFKIIFFHVKLSEKKTFTLKKSRWKSLGKTKGFHVSNSDFIKKIWQVTNIFSGERNVKTFCFFFLCEKWGRKCFQVQCMKRTLNIFCVKMRGNN